MEAAKRMYDNTYDQRLETAALAKAYLEREKGEDKEVEPVVQTKRKTTNRLCSVIGISTSLLYCLLIFGMLIMPLVKETELHRIKIEHSQYKREIARLTVLIGDAEKSYNGHSNLVDLETIATRDLGLVKRSDSMKRDIKDRDYISLDDAKASFYNTTMDYVSED